MPGLDAIARGVGVWNVRRHAAIAGAFDSVDYDSLQNLHTAASQLVGDGSSERWIKGW
jgi:hypothetical protein